MWIEIQSFIFILKFRWKKKCSKNRNFWKFKIIYVYTIWAIERFSFLSLILDSWFALFSIKICLRSWKWSLAKNKAEQIPAYPPMHCTISQLKIEQTLWYYRCRDSTNSSIIYICWFFYFKFYVQTLSFSQQGFHRFFWKCWQILWKSHTLIASSGLRLY